MNTYNEPSSCANCKYAEGYILIGVIPGLIPKGHGKCELDKVCSDYKLLGRLSR